MYTSHTLSIWQSSDVDQHDTVASVSKRDHMTWKLFKTVYNTPIDCLIIHDKDDRRMETKVRFDGSIVMLNTDTHNDPDSRDCLCVELIVNEGVRGFITIHMSRLDRMFEEIKY